jgi:hypothetical protein
MSSWGILLATAVYQIIFYSDIINIVAIAAVIFAWIITSKIWLDVKMLELYPISSFMILGYVSSQFYFPLLFTTLENKPLINNLELPEQVFLHTTLCLLVLVFAHAHYRFLRRFSLNRSVSIYKRLGLFDPPSHLQVWVIGFIGMAASYYVFFNSPEIGREVTGAAGDKFVQGLAPFAYAPFFIPLCRLYGSKEKIHKGFLFMIICYTILLFGISIARNSRGAFIFGLTTFAFAYALALFLGVYKTKIITVKNIVIVTVIGWLFLGPFTDLGTAMLIVRGSRQDIPPAQLISMTLETLSDKEALKARADEDKTELADYDWDERYLDNIFTSRFSNLKFNDNSLITYSRLGQYDPDMQQFSMDQLIAALPDPVIRLFDLDVDKEAVLSLSIGDYLYVLSGGSGAAGGFRVGHLAGTGMATFGWWYLLVLGILSLPVFYLNDKLFRRKKGIELEQAQVPGDRFQFSFCAILALTFYFQFFLIESVTHAGTYLIRGWIQMIVLYVVIFHLSRILCIPFSRKRRRLQLPSN